MKQTYSNRFQSMLAAAINRRIEHLREEVAAGELINFEDYKFKTGQISGLSVVLSDLFDEVEDFMRKE